MTKPVLGETQQEEFDKAFKEERQPYCVHCEMPLDRGDILGPPKSNIIQRFAEKHNIRIFNIPLEKPTSKKALKVLNEKEKQLKESIMKLIIESGASDAETIRVCAWILNNFKGL